MTTDDYEYVVMIYKLESRTGWLINYQGDDFQRASDNFDAWKSQDRSVRLLNRGKIVDSYMSTSDKGLFDP